MTYFPVYMQDSAFLIHNFYMSKHKIQAKLEKEIKLKKLAKKRKAQISEDSDFDSAESENFSGDSDDSVLKQPTKRDIKIAKMKEKYKKLCKEESKINKKRKKNKNKDLIENDSKKSLKKKIKAAVKKEEEKGDISGENSEDDSSANMDESEISEKEEN